MIVIGLTGGIGMGKSTLASQLAAMGAKICNADGIVHKLMAGDCEVIAEVARQFPGVVHNQVIDRKKLGEVVFKDKAQLKKLEHLLHPLVVAAENRFIARERRLGAKFVVLDIPLLFETEAEKRCDLTIVTSAPRFLQRQRVLKRPNMTPDKFEQILRSQMPDHEKRQRGDHVILTGLGKAYSFRRLAGIVHQLRSVKA